MSAVEVYELQEGGLWRKWFFSPRAADLQMLETKPEAENLDFFDKNGNGWVVDFESHRCWRHESHDRLINPSTHPNEGVSLGSENMDIDLPDAEAMQTVNEKLIA